MSMALFLRLPAQIPWPVGAGCLDPGHPRSFGRPLEPLEASKTKRAHTLRSAGNIWRYPAIKDKRTKDKEQKTF